MNTKLRNDLAIGIYNSEWTYDAAQYCLQTYEIFSGAHCVNAAVRGLSLSNKSDRQRIKRVANKLLALCDAAERGGL